MLKITSPEALDKVIADAVRAKVTLTRITAEHELKLVALQKQFEAGARELRDEIADLEAAARDYCDRHLNDATVFRDGLKSRATALAVFGFRQNPPSVEPASKRVKWSDVVERLARLAWGQVYLRQAPPKPDKEALLADREKLTPEQLTAAGIRFVSDEEFFLTPKPESAQLP